LKTTGINIEGMQFGNPTCPHCGVTYPMIERHDCVFSQEARLKILQEKHDALERAIKITRSTLRDQFAMQAMNAIIAKTEFQESPSDYEVYNKTAIGAYDYADAMLNARNDAE